MAKRKRLSNKTTDLAEAWARRSPQKAERAIQGHIKFMAHLERRARARRKAKHRRTR